VLARDLALPCPTIGLADDAQHAARLMADQQLPALVVCDPDGTPVGMLRGSHVVGVMVPPYLLEDSALARVIDEPAADRLVSGLRGRTVADLLPPSAHGDLVVADADDTVMELCVLMADGRSPVIPVVDGGRLLGCVTLHRLLDSLLSRTR
jgi:CBS-domain-containing membrane protein